MQKASTSAFVVLLLLAAITGAAAEQITIVALGTSNSRGRGLAVGESYPAQLQSMLKAKGINAHVVNMGVNGDTSSGMLARVNAVPKGTRLVLLEWARNNEIRRNVANTSANMAAIENALAARNIKSIDVTGIIRLEFQRARAAGNLISAGGPHLNAAAYRDIAAQVLPQVEAAIGH